MSLHWYDVGFFLLARVLPVLALCSPAIYFAAGSFGAFDRAAARRIERRLADLQQPSPLQFKAALEGVAFDFLNPEVARRGTALLARGSGPYASLARDLLGTRARWKWFPHR